LNLGKLAYHIDCGHLDTSKVITQKDLKDAGVIAKVKDGVKLLSKGIERFKDLNLKLYLEITDASATALEAIKAAGGSVQHKYRTDLLMRHHLSPHKFSQHKTLKTPMPPPNQVKKLERLREKGIEVEYPRAPWYNDNLDKIRADAKEKERRMRENPNAKFLPHYPADRSPNSNHVRVEKSNVHIPFKFPN
jgi:hypothetical protein